MHTIYTVGHSTRILSEFVQLLQHYGIETLVDVRHFPVSGKFPHFNREKLEHELPQQGIRYLWLGESLGGYRKGGYEKFMRTAEFQHGIQELLELAAASTLAIMCAELLWFRCHRRFIAHRLFQLSYRVIHIFDASRTQVHESKEEKDNGGE